MTPETFFQNFGHLAEAPNGVQKLRELILQLAVQGKLVQQDPNDTPADELFSRIQETRKQLIETKSIRNPKTPNEIPKGEVPFELPPGWMWTRLGYLIELTYGKSLPKKKRNNEGTVPVFGSNGIVGYHDKPLTPFPSIIVGRKGSCGAVNVANTPCWPIDTTYYVVPPQGLDFAFCFFILKSLYLEKLDKSTAIPGLNREDAYKKIVGLPPGNEQVRIVNSIERLLSLCNELEKRQQKKANLHNQLNKSSLDKLLSSREADEFDENWQRIYDNFDLLYDNQDNVAQLKQVILQLAVMGKLVPQLKPNKLDQDLESIVSKERNYFRLPLTIYGGVNRIFNEEFKSIKLPKSWGILPLSKVALAIVDCPHSTPKWTDTGVVCVRTNQFKPGFLDLSQSKFVSNDTYIERIQRVEPRENDILYSREGGILGVACRVPEDIKLCLGQRMMLIRASSICHHAFLELVLNSPLITTIAKRRTTGGAAPRINVSLVKSYPIPIPPLEEQRCILAKLDSLIALCDQLEIGLKELKASANQLTESVVYSFATA